MANLLKFEEFVKEGCVPCEKSKEVKKVVKKRKNIQNVEKIVKSDEQS